MTKVFKIDKVEEELRKGPVTIEPYMRIIWKLEGKTELEMEDLWAQHLASKPIVKESTNK